MTKNSPDYRMNSLHGRNEKCELLLENESSYLRVHWFTYVHMC